MSVDLIYKHQQKTYALMNEALEKKVEQHMFIQLDVGNHFQH